jgi:hypothetical protein
MSCEQVDTKQEIRNFWRIEITSKVVDEALAVAAANKKKLADAATANEKIKLPTSTWADTRYRYLTIRVRGGSPRWTVRSMGSMQPIGDLRERQPDYLALRDARKKAGGVYAEMRAKVPRDDVSADESEAAIEDLPVEAPPPEPWTVSRVCLEFTAYMARPRWLNERTKPPSPATVDDIRRAFAHDSVQALGPIPVTELTRAAVIAARNGIVSRRDGSGLHRSRSKFVVWFRAAMSWAATKRPDESRLVDGIDHWWERLDRGEPSQDEQVQIAARRTLRLQRKADLDVGDIGRILARHEKYCAGRSGRDMVGPGVRFGLWWVNLTANRRYTTVKLERANLKEQDEFGEPGWGRAMWEEDQMKAKQVFWLPLPPAVRDIAMHSMEDWQQLVRNEHGELETRWVFASTRREGRDPGNDDVSVYPNSLNRHLSRMRAAGALNGIDYYSLHLARAAMTAFLEKNVSPRAASLALAHAIKNSTDREMAPTTRDYYSVSQHMDEKAVAMRAWSEALLEAFLDADGKMPEPSATIRKPKTKPRTP